MHMRNIAMYLEPFLGFRYHSSSLINHLSQLYSKPPSTVQSEENLSRG